MAVGQASIQPTRSFVCNENKTLELGQKCQRRLEISASKVNWVMGKYLFCWFCCFAGFPLLILATDSDEIETDGIRNDAVVHDELNSNTAGLPENCRHSGLKMEHFPNSWRLHSCDAQKQQVKRLCRNRKVTGHTWSFSKLPMTFLL